MNVWLEDHIEVATHLKTLYRAPALRVALGKNAKRTAVRYDWSTINVAIAGNIKTLLSPSAVLKRKVDTFRG